MRASQKRGILEMINTLHEAHDEIKKNILLKQYDVAGDLIGQCQQCAITIGTAIESSEGEGFVTVALAEEYCEALFRAYEELTGGEPVNAGKIYKALRKGIVRFENSAKQDIASKKEIVFLPYTVSMWDSLESIWQAAEEDPECDAYVVPIPYYDKNADGSFRQEHYEGLEFPLYVPITHYSEYDFADRRPDAIFIHNPYDQNNYVTSVHPSFYSDKLKGYTDRLIYIPYYVSDEANSDSREVMEGRASYVLSSGVFNADMVFVQSENTKKLFVNILQKHIPDIDRGHWENKIWGVGSPKLDRVKSVERDDTKLPEAWRELIYTGEGVRKKTVLYNISVNTLLNNPDMLDKIRDTLAFFKHSGDAVLWWRPHPLYESTLASMRPWLLAEYREIVRKYKEEAWGIFDEGVDLEWAIAETDGYYGDGSSVVQLYREAQKPVMIQNASVRADREIQAEDIPIWPSAFCVDGDDIWFVHGKMNVLMRYSMSENYTYVIGTIPNEKLFQERAFIGVYKWINKVFLIPSWAREVVVYDSSRSRFEKISVDRIEEFETKALFGRIHVKHNYLFCIPFGYDAIVKINMENNNLQYIKMDTIDSTYIQDTVLIQNHIIGVFAHTNRALFFNTESNAIAIKKIGNSSRQFSSIAYVDNSLYLFDECTHAVVEVCSEEFDQVRELFKTVFSLAKLTSISQHMMLIDPADCCEMQIYNIKEKNVFKFKEDRADKSGNMYSVYYSGIENDTPISSGGAYYFSRTSYCMYQFKDKDLQCKYFMSLDDVQFSKLASLLVNMKDKEYEENIIYNVKIWTKGLEKQVYSNKNNGHSCGKMILQKVKEKKNE